MGNRIPQPNSGCKPRERARSVFDGTTLDPSFGQSGDGEPDDGTRVKNSEIQSDDGALGYPSDRCNASVQDPQPGGGAEHTSVITITPSSSGTDQEEASGKAKGRPRSRFEREWDKLTIEDEFILIGQAASRLDLNLIVNVTIYPEVWRKVQADGSTLREYVQKQLDSALRSLFDRNNIDLIYALAVEPHKKAGLFTQDAKEMARAEDLASDPERSYDLHGALHVPDVLVKDGRRELKLRDAVEARIRKAFAAPGREKQSQFAFREPDKAKGGIRMWVGGYIAKQLRLSSDLHADIVGKRPYIVSRKLKTAARDLFLAVCREDGINGAHAFIELLRKDMIARRKINADRRVLTKLFVDKADAEAIVQRNIAAYESGCA